MDELLIRQAPHSPEAEQAVLGSMLIDADCVKDVMDKLQPEDFYLRQNREIFETIYSMFVYSKPIDGVTVAGEMERSGLYTNDTRGYLVQLMEVTPTSANVMEYVKIVREKALLRAVASAAADITAMVQEGTGEANAVLEAAEQKIYAIRRELKTMIHPKAVNIVKVNGKKVKEETMRGVYIYFIAYILILIVSVLLISINNFDFTTSFTGVLTTLNNVGPGLNLVGPVENFAKFSDFSKIVFCVDMLIGRLEIFPFLMLFSPSLWSRKF